MILEREECLGNRLRELCILVSLIDGLLGCQYMICCSNSARFKFDQTYLHTFRVRYLIYRNWVEPPKWVDPLYLGQAHAIYQQIHFLVDWWLINKSNTASPCRGQDIHSNLEELVYFKNKDLYWYLTHSNKVFNSLANSEQPFHL